MTKAKEEFNLSERGKPIIEDSLRYWYAEKDVKEFIKMIEQEIILGSPNARQNLIKLRKLAGAQLCQ